MLFLHVTSRIEGDKYQDLLSEKGGRGFPYLVFMDPDGNVVAKHEGPRTVEGFRHTGEAAQKFLALRDKAESGTPEEQVEFFLAGLDIGYFSPEQSREKLGALKQHMSDEQVKRVESKLLDSEIEGLLNELGSEEDAVALGGKFVEWAKEGRIPSDDSQVALYFWILQLQYADDSENLAVAENVLKEIKARYGDEPQYAQLVAGVTEKVDEMRELLSEDDDGDGGGR